MNVLPGLGTESSAVWHCPSCQTVCQCLRRLPPCEAQARLGLAAVDLFRCDSCWDVHLSGVFVDVSNQVEIQGELNLMAALFTEGCDEL